MPEKIEFKTNFFFWKLGMLIMVVKSFFLIKFSQTFFLQIIDPRSVLER